MGTIEVTRLGMGASEMEIIAGFVARLLAEGAAPDAVCAEVLDFRRSYQTLYYCFYAGLPPS